MTAYNTTLLIKKIIEKTRSLIIKWEKYDVNNDLNKFSSKYFSTINEINSNAGYFMSYYNGRLFCYLILAESSICSCNPIPNIYHLLLCLLGKTIHNYLNLNLVSKAHLIQ